MAAETVATVGEFALIDRLAAVLAETEATARADQLGIGDDAALWSPTPSTRGIVTTDSLIAGVHFRLDWTTWPDLGHKALAVNVSDIAAMGGRPLLAVVSLSLTGRELVTDLLDLYRGLGSLAARLNLVVAGGDIVAAPDCLGLHLTVIGESWPEANERVLRRDGAHPGDLLAVSGPLGLAAAGLQLLLRGEPVSAAEQVLLAAHHRPEPRIAYGRALVAGGASAAMDLSDGLLGDLAKICARSQVATIVDVTALPVPAIVRKSFPDEWPRLAMQGGEDYELLFTVAPAAFAELCEQCAAQGVARPIVIGNILPATTDAPIRLRQPDGTVAPVSGTAFDHFAR